MPEPPPPPPLWPMGATKSVSCFREGWVLPLFRELGGGAGLPASTFTLTLTNCIGCSAKVATPGGPASMKQEFLFAIGERGNSLSGPTEQQNWDSTPLPVCLRPACPLCALNAEGQNWWLGVLTLSQPSGLGEVL